MIGLQEQEAYEANGGHVAIVAAGRALLEINDPPAIDEVEVGLRVARRVRVCFEGEDTRVATNDLVAAGARVVPGPQ